MSVQDTAATQVSTTEEQSDRWEPVRPLPPSCKLVVKTLDNHDRLTQQQLAAETLLATRTVREAVSRLEEQGVVDSRVSFLDARKQLYQLTI